MKKLIPLFLCFLTYAFNNDVSANNFIYPNDLEQRMNNEIILNSIDIVLLENSVIYLSNQYRLQKGKKVLTYNKQLSHAAYLHSSQMVEHNFFNHINPYNKTLRDIENRAKYVGYKNYETLSENILYGYIDIEEVGSYKDLATLILNNFIESKGHKDNLLDYKINEIGCGIAFEQSIKDGYWYFYFTQDFGKRL